MFITNRPGLAIHHKMYNMYQNLNISIIKSNKAKYYSFKLISCSENEEKLDHIT